MFTSQSPHRVSTTGVGCIMGRCQRGNRTLWALITMLECPGACRRYGWGCRVTFSLPATKMAEWGVNERLPLLDYRRGQELTSEVLRTILEGSMKNEWLLWPQCEPRVALRAPMGWSVKEKRAIDKNYRGAPWLGSRWHTRMVSMEEIWLHPRMLNSETRLREYSKAEVVQPPTLTPLCAPDRRHWRIRLTPDRETESMYDPTPTHYRVLLMEPRASITSRLAEGERSNMGKLPFAEFAYKGLDGCFTTFVVLGKMKLRDEPKKNYPEQSYLCLINFLTRRN